MRQLAAAQQRRDLLGDLVLHGEDIAGVALELLRPLVKTGGDVDELHGDAQAVAGLAHAALEQTTDSELAAHFAQVVVAAKLERGRARGDAQPVDVRERVDEFFGQALA